VGFRKPLQDNETGGKRKRKCRVFFVPPRHTKVSLTSTPMDAIFVLLFRFNKFLDERHELLQHLPHDRSYGQEP